MIKILTIIGARPQFIKAAALSHHIAARDDIDEIIVHSGQHYDDNMSKIFFDELSLPRPNYTIKKTAKNNVDMIANQLVELNRIIQSEKPDYVLVYGDTDTTLAGAISANKNSVKLIHVEAGLRSFNIEMPEENNRKLTDCISDLLFTTDQLASENLLSENTQGNIFLVGDIMLETLCMVKGSLESRKTREPYALATLHRPSNIDNPKNLREIVDAFAEISKQFPVIIPAHPRSFLKFREIIESNIKKYKNINLIEPVGYIEMLTLVKNCSIVLTDSGGLQKEAVHMNKKCVVLRNETEWKLLEKNKYVFVLDEITSEEILKKVNDDFCTDYSNLPDPSSVSKAICNKIVEYHDSIHNHKNI